MFIKQYLWLTIVGLTVFAQAVAAQDNGSVMVMVRNARNTKGKMMVALYKKEHFLDESIAPFRATTSTIGKGGVVNKVIDNLPPGDYGVAIFHDENDNSKMDTNFLGIPTEGYGFSNNTRPRFSAPSFAACRFSVKAGAQKPIVIELLY